LAHFVSFDTHVDDRGKLSVYQDQLGFNPARAFLIYDLTAPRGGHGHFQAKSVLIAATGRFRVEVRTKGKDPVESRFFEITNPSAGLFLDPEDWHRFEALEAGSVLLCISSEPYRKEDYFYERP
jgi:hypothetical protein